LIQLPRPALVLPHPKRQCVRRARPATNDPFSVSTKFRERDQAADGARREVIVGARARSALLMPDFSCWLDPQSDFGFRPNAVEAQSLRISPKAGLWRGSQRCVSA